MVRSGPGGTTSAAGNTAHGNNIGSSANGAAGGGASANGGSATSGPATVNNSANQTQGLSQSIQGTLSAAKTKTVTVTKNKNFGKLNSRQAPRSVQLGFRVSF